MRVLVLLVLVGCYSPGYRDCEVTCGGGSCPGGFVCDQGVCRVEGFSGACGAGTTPDATVDSSPPEADDDHDGITNAVDNCPQTANAMQENKDRDARGDACDPCPVDPAPAGDTDTDGDGVGDGCDPEMDQRNQITRFEGFYTTTPPMGAQVMGTWTFGNGRASVNAGPTERATIAWPEPSAATPSVQVSASFTVNSVDTTAFNELGAGVAHHMNTPNDETKCVLGYNEGGNGLYLLRAGNGGEDPLEFGAGTSAVTFSYRNGSAYECGEAVSTKNVSAGFTPGAVGNDGFLVASMNVTVSWILVVARAP